LEPTPSAHAVSIIDWIARLASESANLLSRSAATITASAAPET
jgi:hypothetical protein